MNTTLRLLTACTFDTIATGIPEFVFMFCFMALFLLHLQRLSGFEPFHQTTAFNTGIIFVLSCVDFLGSVWNGHTVSDPPFMVGPVRQEFVSDCIITLHGCTIGIELNSIIEKGIGIYCFLVILEIIDRCNVDEE